MDSICVGGTFHCSSDNEWQSSWCWIHHDYFASTSTPPPLFSSSIVFLLQLSATSPFLINNFRSENSSRVRCSHKALPLLLNYSQHQFSASVIKNTSYCYQIDSPSQDRNGSEGEEKLSVSSALVRVPAQRRWWQTAELRQAKTWRTVFPLNTKTKFPRQGRRWRVRTCERTEHWTGVEVLRRLSALGQAPFGGKICARCEMKSASLRQTLHPPLTFKQNSARAKLS